MLINQVEQYMNALGEPVRYQPTPVIPLWELLNRIDYLQGKVYDLMAEAGVQVQTHVAYNWQKSFTALNLEKVLLTLAQLEYCINSIKLTIGLQRYDALALNELHQSKLSKIWPDGKIHKASNGVVLNPESYHEPVMTSILQAYNPPNLFQPHPLPEVIHESDTDGPITLE